jgi:hypothetical protein
MRRHATEVALEAVEIEQQRRRRNVVPGHRRGMFRC